MVRKHRFDISLDDPLAQMDRIWNMPSSKLALFTNIDQDRPSRPVVVLSIEVLLERFDRAFGDIGSGFVDDL